MDMYDNEHMQIIGKRLTDLIKASQDLNEFMNAISGIVVLLYAIIYQSNPHLRNVFHGILKDDSLKQFATNTFYMQIGNILKELFELLDKSGEDLSPMQFLQVIDGGLKKSPENDQ